MAKLYQEDNRLVTITLSKILSRLEQLLNEVFIITDMNVLLPKEHDMQSAYHSTNIIIIIINNNNNVFINSKDKNTYLKLHGMIKIDKI